MNNVKFSDLDKLIENCSYRTNSGEIIKNESALNLFEWASVSRPMIMMAGNIIGMDRVIDMLEDEEEYYELLELAGWDAQGINYILNFFGFIELLSDIQIKK